MIVSVRGLTKSFAIDRTWRQMITAPGGGKRVKVVDNVSFDVHEGEIFGLLGQNGAGKTTIFKMLTTLITPDEGTALIDGHDVEVDERAVREILAPVIANERSLYWRLSARENIRLFAALQGLHGREAAEEEDRVLGVVGLTDTGEKMVNAFSSGMRQRLLIARALLGKPRVLLLDEPTRSLDPISARDFRRFIRDTVVGEQRCTILLATHDADEVWELCDRVGVLERGRLLEVDTTAALRHRTGGDRYRAWVRTTDSAAVMERLSRLDGGSVRRGSAAEAGWDELEFDLPGSADVAAQALAVVSDGGVSVARFEKVAPSLADMIERVVKRPHGANGHA